MARPLFKGYGESTINSMAKDFVCYSLLMHSSLIIDNMIKGINEASYLLPKLGSLNLNLLKVSLCRVVYSSEELVVIEDLGVLLKRRICFIVIIKVFYLTLDLVLGVVRLGSIGSRLPPGIISRSSL